MDGLAYARRYRQAYPLRIRDAARHAALSVLSGAAALGGRLEPALQAPRIQFLYLHHVFPDERGAFRRLLAELARRHHFLSYSEAVERVWDGRIGAPTLAVSFDDGLLSCREAAETLADFGIRACFFVCPSIIGETRLEVLRNFCRDRLHKPPMQFLGWSDLERLARAGHEIGSHSLTHANLAALDESRLAEEIAGSRELLARRLGAPRHFAWPFGRFRYFSERAGRMVREAGYVSCASGERGCHIRAERPERLVLRRDLVVARWPVRHVLYLLARNSRCVCCSPPA